MTNCFHHNQPAIARVGAKQKLCAVSSPVVKERLWAWDFNNERDGANWLPPFSSSTQVCTHCTKERGTLSAACTPGPQLALMARSQSCAFVLQAWHLLWPLGGAQGYGRSLVTCEPFIRAWPNPGGASVLTGNELRRNSVIRGCNQLQWKCQIRPYYLLKSKNCTQKARGKCFQC